MDGADAIIKKLAEHKVDYIFGYSGGAAIPIFDALARSDGKIKFILARHEQGAIHMADGYARSSGRPGVVLVTSGPGAGNIVSGLMTANMDSVPLVVISGQQITSMLGYDAFQEADIFDITMPVTKHNYLVRKTADLPRIVDEAFHIATTGRPGPVLIDVPKDVSSGDFKGNLNQALELPAYKAAPKPSISKIKQIMTAWSKAKKPIILAGHGVILSGATEALYKLAMTMDTPVTNTLLGKGAFPETDNLALGMLGMHGTAYANKAVVVCDFLLNIGSRFDDRIIGKASEFCNQAYIAHIDIDRAELGKMIKPAISIQSDAKAAIETMLSLGVGPKKNANWRTTIDLYKKDFSLGYDNTNGLTAQNVIDAIYQKTAGSAYVATDVGQHQMWAAQFYKTDQPDHWLSSGGAGTMGFGMPAAIGAQFANPGKTVVAFVGDGGFQMTQYELATACIHKLPIKIVILNNHYLGMVRQWQELFYENRQSGVDLEGNPDFAKLAEAYGASGININSVEELDSKIEQAMAINDRPVVINAEVIKTDNVYPMVPAGASLTEMIIEKPTTKLSKPIGST